MKVAILVTDNFEQVEMTKPREALESAGAQTMIVSEKRGMVQGVNHDRKADQFPVDATFDEVNPQDVDAVLLPGGAWNADQIRIIPGAQRIVKSVEGSAKPIAVICHGPWLLVSAGLVQGRTLTSWPTLQDDIRNAGGTWVNKEAQLDRNWVSSRKPDDIPAFNVHMIQLFAQHRQGRSLAQGGRTAAAAHSETGERALGDIERGETAGSALEQAAGQRTRP
jgi:protease I